MRSPSASANRGALRVSGYIHIVVNPQVCGAFSRSAGPAPTGAVRFALSTQTFEMAARGAGRVPLVYLSAGWWKVG
jgi:hypothetical protein